MFTSFHASIPPFIAGQAWSPTAESSALGEEAAAAIVRLDSTAGQVLAPLTAFLLRNEAQSSSKIEHVNTSQDDLARAQLGIRASENARSTVAASDAITALIDAAATGNPADGTAIAASHHALMKDDISDGPHAGKIRDVQNWIGGSEYSPRGAVHVPPEPGRVPALMSDLRDFCERRDLPTLAQAAIAHAQFETIHPFTDGNGRVGRALINAVFRYRGLTCTAVVPVASAFAARREWYFSLVNTYREGHASLFIDFLARCSIVVCFEAAASARLLQELPDRWREAVAPRANSAAEKIIASLLETPLLTIETAVERQGVSRTAATVAIRRLEDAGIVRSVGRGQRHLAWAAGEVLDEAESLVQRIETGRERLLTASISSHLDGSGLLGR